MKLPSQKDCLEKAYRLCADVEPEIEIDGEIAPKEIIFYEEQLIELIRYCQGKIQ